MFLKIIVMKTVITPCNYLVFPDGSGVAPKTAAVNARKLRRNCAEGHTKLYIEHHYFANTCPSSTPDAGPPDCAIIPCG
jgi:hypothetical protein